MALGGYICNGVSLFHFEYITLIYKGFSICPHIEHFTHLMRCSCSVPNLGQDTLSAMLLTGIVQLHMGDPHMPTAPSVVEVITLMTPEVRAAWAALEALIKKARMRGEE